MALVAVAECESCGRRQGEKHRATESRPDMDELEEMMSEGVDRATDGCDVEPDGVCEHGHSSWLLVLGLI
jgi:hypothetical protein